MSSQSPVEMTNASSASVVLSPHMVLYLSWSFNRPSDNIFDLGTTKYSGSSPLSHLTRKWLYSLVLALAVILTETFNISEDKKINPYKYSEGLV